MLEFSQVGSDTTSLYLTPEQGEALRDAIERDSKKRFSSYILSVGMLPQNVYGILSGRKKLSYRTLVRLLSNTSYGVECRIEFLLQKQSGKHAVDVPSPELEEMLYSEGGGELGEDLLIEKDGQLTMLEFLQQNELQD
jgi:hypothetical protein